MNKKIIALLLLTTALSLSGCAAVASPTANAQPKSEAKTSTEVKSGQAVNSKDEAVRLALESLPTNTNPTVESAKLVTRDGKDVWDVVLREREGRKLHTIVLIDPGTGKVLDTLIEVGG